MSRARLNLLGALFGLLPLFGARAAQEPAASVAAQDLQDHFQQANKAYLDGAYQTAVSEYEKVLDAGVVHPDLFFNLGNAYYRAGRKGLSVLYLQKALDLDPSDEAAASNLAAVRKSLIDQVVMPEQAVSGEAPWQEFLRGLSLSGLTWAFFSLYFLAVGVMVVRRLVVEGPLRRLLFWINVPILSLTLVVGLMLASRVYVQERVHRAVVISPTAQMLEGPERSAKALMEVHEGLELQLLSEAGEYVRVRLANGVEGFLQNSQLGKI